MKWKIFIILIIAVLLCFGIMMLVGTASNKSLNKDYGKIDSLDEVEGFIEDCNNKLFLNCDELLLRRIRR